MIKIEIKTLDAEQRIVGKEDRKTTMLEQTAWAYIGNDPYPTKLRVTQWLDKSTGEMPAPYPIGEYTLSPESLSIGNYDRMQINPVLIPLEKQSK